MRRIAEGALLLLLGNAVLRIALEGTYVYYVKEGLRPLLIGSGAVLVALGAAALAEVLLPRRRPAPTCGHGDLPRVAWLLVLPVFTVFLVAPGPLGSYAAARDSGTVPEPRSSHYPPLPPGDPVQLGLGEYAVRAVWDSGRTLTGRTVALTGFVTHREAGGWYLTRMALTCCAADGRATKIEVRGGRELAPDTWVRVVGEYVPTDIDDPATAIAALRAGAVVEVPRPAQPYEGP